MAKCLKCDAEGPSNIYIGETSRTMFTRIGQHINDFVKARRELQASGSLNSLNTLNNETSSWLLDHLLDKHQGELSGFDPWKDVLYKLVKEYRDPLSRQTDEAVRIQGAMASGILTLPSGQESVCVLNRKGEYFSARERWVRD